MHNCTVVNYSTKRRTGKYGKKHKLQISTWDCSCIAKQVGTHAKRAKYNNSQWGVNYRSQTGKMVKVKSRGMGMGPNLLLSGTEPGVD